jgi:chemotaxis protein methyltransferase CheR
MRPSEFHAFRDLAYREAGISLRDGKEELVATRIARRMRVLGIEESGAYLEYLQQAAHKDEIVNFIDAISTNFTSFYREKDHFELLTQELRAAAESGARRVRVWCAAAATGEEPWTLALTMTEALKGTSIDWRLLATDISTRALAAATEGRYNARVLAQVPSQQRSRYFVPGEDRDGEPTWRVADELRRAVLFRRLNLARPPFPLTGGLHAVFCRNVMIYFDQAVRQALVTDVERLLLPGGLLVIGHSETLNGIKTSLTMTRPSVYRKPEKA